MASSNSKKRKSPCSDLIFELSDGDVPPESEIPEKNGVTRSKVLKFVETEQLPGDGPQDMELEKGISSTIPAEPSDNDITTDGSRYEVTSPLVQITDSIILPSDIEITSDELQSKITSPLQLSPQSIIMLNDDDVRTTEHQNNITSPCKCASESTHIPNDDYFIIIPNDDDDSTIHSPHDKTPLLKQNQEPDDLSISITFSNKKLADLYKYKFFEFIESFVELEAIDENDLNIRVTKDSTLDPSEWVIVDKHSLDDTKLKTTHMKHKKKKKTKSKRSPSPFVIDKKPEGNSGNKSSLYSFGKFEIEVNKPDDDSKVCQPTQSCFNCAGSHSLKDCSVPKNHSRISAARNRHRSQYKNTKYQRYHISPDDQDYSHLRPGFISDKLRDALGLKKNELPSYIYSMRRIGYPPGWLEEAKTYHSDLDNNDSRNKIHLRRDKRAAKLDPNKIVEYPGFNVPCDKNVKDEHRYYKVPAYSQRYHKSVMMKFYEEMSKHGSGSHDKDKDHAQEKSKSSYKITKEQLINPVKKKQHMDVDLDLETHSPTLVDLEEQKKHLLAALTESSCVASNEVTLNETEENVGENSNIEKQANVKETLPLDTTNEENTSQNQDAQSIKSTIYGTPLLKSCSPYTKLPDAENFMKGVSPIINFENLPNSTGKYEKMKTLLEKVRREMNNSDRK